MAVYTQLSLCLETKRCTRCHETKPLTDFTRRSKRPSGRSEQCKKCESARRKRAVERQIMSDPGRKAREDERRREESRAYHATARAREARKNYLIAKSDDDRVKRRDWEDRNRERRSAQARDRYRADPERHREVRRRSNARNRVVIRERIRQYSRENRDIINAIAHRRIARLRSAGGSYTAAEWRAIKEGQDYTCLMCGKREPEIKLTVDHVVPIALGGRNDTANIQGLCKPCNSSKKARIIDLRGKEVPSGKVE